MPAASEVMAIAGISFSQFLLRTCGPTALLLGFLYWLPSFIFQSSWVTSILLRLNPAMHVTSGITIPTPFRDLHNTGVDSFLHRLLPFFVLTEPEGSV